MGDQVISSLANPLIKEIRALQQRKYRQEHGAFFVEGIRPVWQALTGGAEVTHLVYAPDLLTSDAARKMIQAEGSKSAHPVAVSSKVFQSLGRREHPSGIGAVVRMNNRTIDDLDASAGSVFVALEHAGNPGNIGTILRTLDAVAGSGLILAGNTADPYDPTAVKASMGAIFSVPVARVGALKDVFNWAGSRQVFITTTSPGSDLDYWSAAYRFPVILVFGSEGEGLTNDAVDQGNIAVRIPMSGTADSLNLAVSVGIMLYEVQRQKSGVRAPMAASL